MTANTLNVILIILFVFLIVFSLLSCFIGYKKGIYKTTLKIIIKTILLTVDVFMASGVAAFIGSINIQNIVGSPTSYSIHDFIVNLISETGLFSPVNGASVYATSIAIADSLLAYVSFLLGVILIQIVSPFLTALLYFGIFKNILNVENDKDRKEKKKNKEKYKLLASLKDENGNVIKNPKKKIPQLKLLSSFLGFIQEFIFLIVLISPITALSSTVIDNKDSIDNFLEVLNVDDDSIDTFDGYSNVIENSILYKMISNTTLDKVIMNKVSQVTVNGVKVSFNGLIDSIFDVANPLVDSEVISYDEALSRVTVNYSALLSLTTVDTLLTSMINNPMLLSLIPPILDVGMNSISGNYFAINELSFINIDYTSELSIIKSIYKTIYDSAIEPMLTGDKIEYDKFNLNTSNFSDDEIDDYVEAISSLGKLETVKNNIATILSSAGVFLNNRGYKVFPTEKEAYESIDWEKDLKIISNVGFKFLRIISLDISSKMNINTLKDKLLSSLSSKNKRDEIQTLICGNSTSKGLLDTDIFSVLYIGDLIQSSLYGVNSLRTYVKNSNISSTLEDYSIADYKSEFNEIFLLLDILYSEDSKLSLNNLTDIDFEDEDTIEQLVELLNTGKKSKIFSTLYPSILKSVLFNNSFNFSNYLFGLTPYNFNYDSETFLDDFTSFLNLLPSLRKIQNNLENPSLSRKEKIDSVDTSTINELLKILIGSEFFNSDQKTGISSNSQKNVNIQTFLTNFLSESLFSNYAIVIPSLEELQTIDWDTEIDILTTILDKAKDNSDFISSEKKDVDKIINRESLSDLLELSFDSKILSPSILEVIDTSLNDYLKNLGIQLSIDDMRNSLWKDDADDIVSLLLLFQGLDMSSLDLKRIDANRLNAILTLLCNANFIESIKTTSIDKFGYAFYSLLKAKNTFTDLGISTPEFSLFNRDKKAWSNTLSVSYITRTINDEDKSDIFYITSEGLIKEFSDFIKVMQRYDLNFSDGNLPTGFINDIKELTGSDFIRGIITQFISNSFDKLKLPSSFSTSITSIDFSLLKNETQEQFNLELELLDYLFYLTKSKYEDTSLFEYMIKNIYSLNGKSYDGIFLLDIFDNLIDRISHSILLKNKRNGCSLSPIQSFYKSMVSEMGLIEEVTLTINNNYQDDVLNGILLSVSDYDEELIKLKELIKAIQGYDSDFKISAFESFDDSYSVLSLLNESEIFHRVSIYIIKTSIENTDFNHYLYDKEGKYYPLNYYVKLDTSFSSIQYWDNEIYYLLKIMTESLATVFQDGNDISSFDIYSKDDDSYLFSQFMYYVSKINLFKDSRSLVIYNILEERFTSNGDISLLIRDSNANIYGVNRKVYKFEELYFSKIDNSSLIMTDAIKEVDCLLDNLNNIIKYMDVIKNGTLSSIKSISFENMNLNCFYNDNQTRSSLASEFLAGFESLLLKTTYFSSHSFDLYENDYALINPIDGKGLDGLISLFTLEIKEYYSYNELENSFIDFGSNSYPGYTLYSYNSSNNSNFAVEFLDTIKNIKVKQKENLEVVNLSSLILFDSLIDTDTFYSLFDGIKDKII